MINLRTKLALFNLTSKVIFAGLIVGFLPLIVERINIIQTDRELIEKREKMMALISEIGIEPFITSEKEDEFGSYNILKEEFISLERADLDEDWNFIEISPRIIEDETIDYRVLNYSFRVDGRTYLLEIGKSLVSISHTARNIKMVILILLAAAIIIALASDLAYTGRTLRPLKQIVRKLKATSTPSLFDGTPVKTTTSDFFQLDQTITDLMTKLDVLFRKEKEITVNISHELLTPVQVMRSKLENILLQKDLDEEVACKIEESLKTLHRLATLVNSLLTIARIESRQYLKEDTVEISELLNEVREEILPVASDTGIVIREDFTDIMKMHNVNRSLLFSMFFNVINNSVRHTSPGGVIIIKTELQQGRLSVSVNDNGSGMTREQMANLFSRFRKKIDPNDNGTGIGLAITKSIADFHSVTLSVSSEPGRGTVFSFTFPEFS